MFTVPIYGVLMSALGKEVTISTIDRYMSELSSYINRYCKIIGLKPMSVFL